MDRIGRFTVIVATLLLAGFKPCPCSAQLSAAPTAPIPPPRSRNRTRDQQSPRRGLPPDPTFSLRSWHFPTLADLLQSATHEPVDSRLPLGLAITSRLPSRSGPVTARRHAGATATSRAAAGRVDSSQVGGAARGRRSICEAQAGAARADRLRLPDQPGNRTCGSRTLGR